MQLGKISNEAKSAMPESQNIAEPSSGGLTEDKKSVGITTEAAQLSLQKSLGRHQTYLLDHDFYALNYVYMQCFMHKIR